MKLSKLVDKLPCDKSLPVRGAWVEIILETVASSHHGSLPVRGAWVEMLPQLIATFVSGSLPVRGAWVEIRRFLSSRRGKRTVAPRAGSVG